LKSFSGTGLRDVTELAFTGGFALGSYISASGFDCQDRELVLGRDNRLLSETTKPMVLRLVCSKVATTCIVMGISVSGGNIRPCSFASALPGEKELARSQKMAHNR